MALPTFWDFLMEGGYDLLFDSEETRERQYKCSSCGRVLTQSDKIDCIDEDAKIFKCPFCDGPIEIK